MRLGGHVQFGTRRVAQKIRGNHSLRKQNPHQRASYGVDYGFVNDCGHLARPACSSRVMSSPPSRKSAAIIPSVNKSLTSEPSHRLDYQFVNELGSLGERRRTIWRGEQD